MEPYNNPTKIRVYGKEVTTFPNGIKEAFDRLEKAAHELAQKEFYGISWFGENGRIIYYAAVDAGKTWEDNKDEYKILNIPAGKYNSVLIKQWNYDPAPIQAAFRELLSKGTGATEDRPCIEWYKNNGDVLCLFRQD
jgi:predicted transcriptional regulator YdeE